MAAKIQRIQHFSEALYLRSHVPKGSKFAQTCNSFQEICELLKFIANFTKIATTHIPTPIDLHNSKHTVPWEKVAEPVPLIDNKLKGWKTIRYLLEIPN